MHILVTVASRHGATTEIGMAIAEELRQAGHEADLRDPAGVASLDGYDAVVLGSAVYAGRWLESARRFSERHQQALRGRPTWVFSSGPIGDPLAPTDEATDGLRLVTELAAHEHRTFAGRVNAAELGWVERTITRMVKAPDGDFRDWPAIRAWSAEIAASLVAPAVVT